MTTAYIALGSNLREPLEQLRRAVTALETLPLSKLERLSSVYRSSAVGPGEQPDYLNAVARLATDLPALDLLDALQDIEGEQGRERDVHWGARTLDLDLLLYGQEQIDSDRLNVPHPRMGERDFVLYPLREINDTTLQLPGGADLDTLLSQCPTNNLVRTQCQLKQRAPRETRSEHGARP